MSKALVKKVDAKIIAVVKDGKLEYKEVADPLRPGDAIDYVSDGGALLVLVMSDEPISPDFVKTHFGEGWRLARSEEIAIRAESWVWPLIVPSVMSRVEDTDTAWWALEKSGEYLESHLQFEEMSPWQRGLVLAAVRSNWERLKTQGAVSGESHWGWARQHVMGNGDNAEWDRIKNRLEEWVRAADVMLMNCEHRDWIAKLTMENIVAIPISKAVRCCGAISDGLFDFSEKLRAALFDQEMTNAQMNHLVALARRWEGYIPVEQVDEETGEIQYVKPATGEVVDEPEAQVLDEFLPDIEAKEEEVSSPSFDSPFWTFDWETRAFGYWLSGEWYPRLPCIEWDDDTRRFVDKIIALCGVRADYDVGEDN